VAPGAAGTPLATTPADYSAHASTPGGSPSAGSAAPATPGRSSAGSGSAKTGSGAGQAEVPTRRPRVSGRGVGKKVFGAMAFLFVAGMAVATSLPAQAHLAMNPESAPIRIIAAESIDQSLTTETSAQASVSRDSYGVTIPVVSAAVAAVSGSVSSFGNPGLGAIQWPLPGGTRISDGFGYRSSPGGIGSTDHMGMDFDPGSGTPIHAIADGVVTTAQKSDNGGLGCYVEIAHNVNGLSFASVYAHMQCATVSMSQGESITVTQLVGLVGNTGASTGEHLHFEIHNSSGTPVDHEIWMRTNAG
jgi:murein DD-endopeptidase MepM/ murein hydrolase activator NlpD